MGIWAHGSFLRKCRQKSAGRLHIASLLEYNKKQLFALFFARTATSVAVMVTPHVLLLLWKRAREGKPEEPTR